MKPRKLTHILTAVLALGFALIAHTTVASPDADLRQVTRLNGQARCPQHRTLVQHRVRAAPGLSRQGAECPKKPN